MNENDSQEGHGKCGAKTRSGGECKRPAGTGTDHVGIGRCKHHGGSTPNHVKAANKTKAEIAVATYGLAREIDPHAALIEELHRTAGHVAWLADLIGQFNTDKELIQTAYSEHGSVDSPAVWVEMYDRERKHFASVAKTCISVGIEERRVKLAEQQGELMAQVIRGLLSDLNIPLTEEVQQVVRRNLTLIQGGAAAA